MTGRRRARYERERDEQRCGGGRPSSRAATAKRYIRFVWYRARAPPVIIDVSVAEREGKREIRPDTRARPRTREHFLGR